MVCYLLWRDVERDRPEVHLPVGVDARDDEENSRTFGATFAQTTQTKYDRSLVFLDNLGTNKISNVLKEQRTTKSFERCHDTQHNDIQHNDTQQKEPIHNSQHDTA